jgi:hypothetical protein
MTEKTPGKYEKIQSKIEKTINPYVTVKIPMPEGVETEAFLKLENDAAFIELLKKQAKEWLTKSETDARKETSTSGN